MPEHSDIYLLLYRLQGKYSEIQVNKLTAPIVAKTLTKGMIIGDSLDVPFVGFIKCQSIEHEIGLSKTQHELKWSEGQRYDNSEARQQGVSALDEAIRRRGHLGPIDNVMRRAMSRGAQGQRIEAAYQKLVKEQRNAFINTHLPEHGEFTFTKGLDRATPQLAFGCCAQEQFPLALFLFRRKAGFGVGAVKFPYLVCALRKVRISAWKMVEGENEAVTLRYADISWASLGTIADTNTPVPIPSARTFDMEALAGGENYSSSWAYGIQFLAIALCAVTGGVIKAASNTSGSYS